MYRIKQIQLKSKYARWRIQADKVNLSTKARLRLEWLIQLDQGEKVSIICSKFGINRSTLYKWKNRFEPHRILSLESKTKEPKTKRTRSFSPIKDMRVKSLRKDYPYYGKEKLKVLYQRIYQEKISSWYIQRVIQLYNLYTPRRGKKWVNSTKKRGSNRVRITKWKDDINKFGLLIHLDTVEIRINGEKRYILTAVDSYTRVAYVYAYRNHSSNSAKDFLMRLYYIFGKNIKNIHTDNGTEFAGYFENAIQSFGLKHWYSRVRVSKDNAKCERFNRTLQDEIYMSPRLGLSCNIDELNVILSLWLNEYLSIRPHASLDYLTPLEFLDLSSPFLSTIMSSRT